jgi:hypothetical protein
MKLKVEDGGDGHRRERRVVAEVAYDFRVAGLVNRSLLIVHYPYISRHSNRSLVSVPQGGYGLYFGWDLPRAGTSKTLKIACFIGYCAS